MLWLLFLLLLLLYPILLLLLHLLIAFITVCAAVAFVICTAPDVASFNSAVVVVEGGEKLPPHSRQKAACERR